VAGKSPSPGTAVDVFHCSCGFAIDDPNEYGDHLNMAFARHDDMGIDGRVHLELATTGASTRTCACGFATDDASEFDDHLLMVFVTPDGIGNDGERHVLVNPSTPDRWYPRETSNE
jgi:hypothetical protein